jgi:hypothetical protein
MLECMFYMAFTWYLKKKKKPFKATPIKFLVLRTNDQKKLGWASELLFIVL